MNVGAKLATLFGESKQPQRAATIGSQGSVEPLVEVYIRCTVENFLHKHTALSLFLPKQPVLHGQAALDNGRVPAADVNIRKYLHLTVHQLRICKGETQAILRNISTNCQNLAVHEVLIRRALQPQNMTSKFG